MAEIYIYLTQNVVDLLEASMVEATEFTKKTWFLRCFNNEIWEYH